MGVALSVYLVGRAWYTDNTHNMSVATVTLGIVGTMSLSLPSSRVMINFFFRKFCGCDDNVGRPIGFQKDPNRIIRRES